VKIIVFVGDDVVFSMCSFFFFLKKKKERKYVIELNGLCKNFEAKLSRWSGKLFLSYLGVFSLHIFNFNVIQWLSEVRKKKLLD